MRAIPLAVFDDRSVAERVRVSLVRDGFPTDRVVGDLVAVFPEVEAMPVAARTRAYFGHKDLPDHVRARARCWPEANGEERQCW
jgi:hypothetical protein